jgi:hypothetical protein
MYGSGVGTTRSITYSGMVCGSQVFLRLVRQTRGPCRRRVGWIRQDERPAGPTRANADSDRPLFRGPTRLGVYGLPIRSRKLPLMSAYLK